MSRSSFAANTMDQASTREREISARSAEVIKAFPALWRRMVNAWAMSVRDERAWLMYSASYLMRTGGARWAIDPVRLEHRLPSAPSANYAADLSALSFVLLTHRHGDHLDLNLIRSLRNLPIIWVVPEPLVRRVTDDANIPARRLIVPEASKPIEFPGLRITPFHGMHWEKAGNGAGETDRGVPAVGYLVEHAGKRWLFPGDTRTYVASEFPPLGPVDILFAHVWLGRAAALQSDSPLLASFCRWCLDLRPARIILTHLEEFGRGPDDYWNMAHAARVASQLRHLRPAINVLPRRMGQSIRL